MTSFRYYIILFGFLLSVNTSSAQMDLTGTWEGIMGHTIFQPKSGQFLQVNIIQNGDKMCGYTYDTVISERGNHCKALFEGVYDKRRDWWVLTGASFLENSGAHRLMRIRIWHDNLSGNNKLEAEMRIKTDSISNERNKERHKGLFDLIRSIIVGDDEPPQQRPEPLEQDEGPEFLQLKRVSSTPPEMPAGVASCFPPLQKPKDSVNNVVIAAKPIPVKPRDSIIAVIPKKDSIKQVVITPPVIKKNDTVSIVQKMTERKNTVFSHLPVDVKYITLNIYDNAIVDGDTVTIFYNGKLLVNKRLLSEKPIVIDLALDEKSKTHEIVLYAENLGSIPPNTALIVVTAGDKRYELHASASLEENAVLMFDYEPKKISN